MLWGELTSLNAKEFKQLRRDVGRVNVPTHEDPIDMRPVQTFLRQCGFKTKSKQQRKNGAVVRIYWLDKTA